ncbi:hypothetical protein HY483_03905 [Candidatus Woesearchaeota archaeon]|nr:hypothetical protein [Candidatus Woesearchaeota archaeon]
MGWIQELADLVGSLNFLSIVHEYEQGLKYSNGSVVDVRIRRTVKELEDIVVQEKDVVKQFSNNYFSFFGSSILLPFKRPSLPKGYRISFLTGRPAHFKRYERDKILRCGLYFHWPIFEDIVTDHKQEKVLNLQYITVPTIESSPDSKEVTISCNIRYELMDFYKAYNEVYDYEASLRDHTLSILAVYSRGKNYDFWKAPKSIEILEDEVLKELRKIVTEKWGLKVHKVYITDVVKGTVQRHLHEGPSIGAINILTPPVSSSQN